MFVADRVARALDEKLEGFRRAALSSAELREQYLTALDSLARLSRRDLESRLSDEQWPGARPTEELDRSGLIVPFARHWESAQEARAWALERLRGVPTAGVDGSQIAASKEFGVPVSLVQVAWFENYHDPSRPYLKDLCDEVIAPDEQAREDEEFVFAESKVNQRRFVLEMETAARRMSLLDPDPPPVVLVDASFVLSFLRRFWPDYGQPYLQALFGLLDASREGRIPVAGYVDRSFASDLATMLRTAFGLPGGAVFDAELVGQRMESFDRTAAFRCARGDILPLYDTPFHNYAEDLCFVYLKVGRERAPARIDFPHWVLDAGLLDHVLDVVRAEILVGGGYPYPLETADAAAVLTTQDRMAFYRLFHDFAEASGLTVALPGKSISKAHRR